MGDRPSATRIYSLEVIETDGGLTNGAGHVHTADEEVKLSIWNGAQTDAGKLLGGSGFL